LLVCYCYWAVACKHKRHLASIPVSVFYNPAVQSKVLRFCFAKSDEVLEAAAEKLCKI